MVFYTRIAPNIDPLKAETLASRAIKSVAALSDDDIARRRDGISYLIGALKNGARTELSSDYEEEIKRQTNTQSLSQALESSLSLRTAPKTA